MPAHLLHGDGGWFGAWLLDLGGRVALLVPHGEDGGGVHHSQVGGQSAVQAAADVLRWGHRVSGPNCSLAHWLPGDLPPPHTDHSCQAFWGGVSPLALPVPTYLPCS